MGTGLRGAPRNGNSRAGHGDRPVGSSLHAATPSERELRARLGLDDRATLGDVLAAHDAVVRFIATAPRSLRAWARVQAAAADEALTLLSDPPAHAASGALPDEATPTGSRPGGPSTPSAHRATTPPVTAPTETPLFDPGAPALEAAPSDDEFEALLAEVTPSMHRDEVGPARPRIGTPARAAAPRPSWRPGRRLVLSAAVLAAAVAIAYGGYQLGAGETAPPIQSASGTGGAADPSPTVDTARVAALMQRIQANPSDTDAMMSLGDEFYQGGDFGAAATWFEKLLKLDPSQVRAGLALGAALFNLGDTEGARTEWEAVLERDPANVEAHYDLGFLYLNQDPPDMAAVERSWREVIRLAPDSEIAATVTAHLDALAARASDDPFAAPSGAPASSPAASPSGLPTVTPAPSASTPGADR